MKKNYLILIALAAVCLFTTHTSAQCTQYDPNSVYSDLQGKLPCDSTCGVPTVTSFELWSNEAYPLGSLKAGNEYDFTLGPPSGAGWNPTMTVAAWNGTNAGAVVGYVDGRNLSITIPSDGEYIFILTVTGSCDGATSNGISNGALSIDCGSGGAICNSTNNINEVAIKNIDFTIHPNPANNNCIINFNGDSNRNLNYLIIDINGKTVLQESLVSKKGVNQHALDLSELSNGVYFIQLNDHINSKRKKLIIAR